MVSYFSNEAGLEFSILGSFLVKLLQSTRVCPRLLIFRVLYKFLIGRIVEYSKASIPRSLRVSRLI